MDVKSIFLNDEIKEEVYMEQPPRFEDPKYHKQCLGLVKLSMALSKLLERGMKE